MPYVRVCCTLQDKGVLLPPEEVDDYIRGQKQKALKPWFVSPYFYGDEVLEYWNSNGKSIGGYQGQAWSEDLYWDLDCADDLSIVKAETYKLVQYLIKDLKLEDGLEIYFSGNKGFHVIVRTLNRLDRQTLSRITSAVIKAAGVKTGYDTSVYNPTRILRYKNTRHEKSELFKIPVSPDELLEDIEYIKSIAETTRPEEEVWPPPNPVDITDLIEKYSKAAEKVVVDDAEQDVGEILTQFLDVAGPDLSKRKCIDVLESGDFGPGERHNALLRIAAYYRAIGLEAEETLTKLEEALTNRASKHPNASTPSQADTEKIISEVFSHKWKGGAFTCKTDEFLASKCSVDGKPCAEYETKNQALGKNVLSIKGLIRSYIKYGAESTQNFAKTGIDSLDRMIRIRPRNYSIIAGAAGAGKTSIISQLMENLNAQKINHLMFSMDMADSSLFEKLGAKYTTYDVRQIEAAFNANTRNERIMREVAEALAKAMPYSYFDFKSTVSMKYIENTIKRLNKDLENPIQLVFVDYAGRLSGEKDSEYANSTENALLANEVAKETNTHIIFISQISRETGDHTTPIRSGRVAKSSGAWEENATFVASLWRPFGDGIDGQDKYLAMYIGKNRSGRLGEIHLSWDGKTGKVGEMSPAEYAEYYDLCKQHNKPTPPGYYDPSRYEMSAEERRNFPRLVDKDE